MSDSNEKLKWLKPLFIFSLLLTTAWADNSTDYSDDDMETVLLIQPAPEVIPECGRNELYQSCEVDCINCEDRGVCEPQNCHVSHCDCKYTFVHLKPGGPCEHISMCPPRECPENEVYRHCGSLCEYCDASPCQTMECGSRCYCKQGYRRNRETGKCIPEKECPQRLECFSNDVLAQSGPRNEYCLQSESEQLRANETIEEEKCFCESGFRRNIHGWCIEEANCVYVTCYEDTEFQDCPKKCNSTCWNYGDPNCVEDGQCYPGCFCREGYVLNEYFACVPVELCPPGSNSLAPPLPPPTVSPIPEPALAEESNSTDTKTSKSSSAAAAESRSGTGSSSSVAESSSGTESSSAAASSSGTESSSAAASSSGTESSSAAASSSGSESSSAATSSSGSESSSAAASSSGSESSSGAAAESGSSSESETGTEKAKEPEEAKTTAAPKKPPKKATKEGKMYKSAARPGKTVAPPVDDEEKVAEA